MNLFKELDKRVDQKYLRKVVSPCGSLVLYNYTDLCTYDRAWDEYTLNARGTVYDLKTEKIVAQAFPKFFNFGELQENKQQEILKQNEFEVYEKMDGSLGIIYFHNGEWKVNTRGSFTSDQAIKAKEMLDDLKGKESLNVYTTYLVEIIYPENRIIVNYGDQEKLVLLGAYKYGKEINTEVADLFGVFEKCPKIKFTSIKKLQKHLETLGYDEEGYVVKLNNTERVKFKSVEYLRLARIMSNMSPLAFWEVLDEDGKIDREFLLELPEEFREECDNISDKIESQYIKVMKSVIEEFHLISSDLGPNFDKELEVSRKQLGIYLKNNKTVHKGAMFSVLLNNNQALHKYVKNYIKPVANVIKELDFKS